MDSSLSTGSEFFISEAMVSDARDLLDDLQAKAGPELQAAIEREKQALDLPSFAGLDMQDAWDELEVRRPREPCYDFNGSGRVDIRDVQAVAEHWRKQSSDPEWDTLQQYDVNDNGVINVLDIMAVSTQLDKECE